MLLLSTTSTFEYPYLDTMGETIKGIYFGGQDRCIILAANMGPCSYSCCDGLLILSPWNVLFKYTLKFQNNLNAFVDRNSLSTSVPGVNISYTDGFLENMKNLSDPKNGLHCNINNIVFNG